jgi:inosose dehydratase
MSYPYAPMSPETVWFGVTPTLWWNDDFLPIDIGIPFEQCVSEMALAGFVGCSVGHKYPTDPAQLRSALELRGLRVSEPWVSTYFTIHSMRAQTVEKVRQQLAFMEAMEKGSDDPRRADLVVAEFGDAVNPLPVALFANAPKFTDAQWTHLIDGLHEIGRMAIAQGRKLCYHPHLGTGVMDEAAVRRLFDNTDPGLVHFLLDTAHLAVAGVDPFKIAKDYAPRIKHIHLKDMREPVRQAMHEKGLSFQQAVEAGIFTVPGDKAEGALTPRLPELFKTLQDAGFAGWLIVEAEQDPAKANPLEYAKIARNFLRQNLGW